MWILSAGLVACSAFAADESTRGGEPDGGPGDAGPDRETPADATSDALPSLGFCAGLSPKPLFCADFDDGREPTLAFPDTTGATLDLDTKHAVSLPASMRVMPSAAYGHAKRSISTVHAVRRRAALDVMVAPAGAEPPTPLIPLRIVNLGAASCAFSVEIYAASTRLDANVSGGSPPPVQKSLGASFQAGSFRRIELVVEKVGSTVAASVLVDGVTVADKEATPCPTLDGPTELFVGLVPSGTGEPRFDDVLYDGE